MQKRVREQSNQPPMSRNPPVDQRSNFIAEYAAKRQTQMDRAKQLRDQRTGSGISAPVSQASTPLNPQPSNTYDQHNQRTSASSYDDLPSRPQNLKAPSSVASNYYSQQQQPQQSPLQYHASNPQYDRHAPQMDYAPQQLPRQAPQTNPQYHSPAPSSHASQSSIEVTETHFREATQRGIITSDQARQLWAVLSDQAIQVKGGVDSYRAKQPASSQPSQQYNPSQYAAPGSRAGTSDKSSASNATYRGSYAHHQLTGQLDDDEDYPQMDYGQPSKVSKSLASRVAKSKKPEWNNEFAEDDAAPVPEPTPMQRPSAKAAPAVKRRPEWSNDNEVNYAEPEPPVAPKAAPKVGASRAPAARSRFDEDDEPSSLDRAFPPKQKKPDQQQQQQPSARQPVAVNRRGPPATTSRGKAPPPIPEPTGPVEQDEEEVDFFLRQKEEAKRQFEDALADADTSEPLEECNVCGRNFRLSILARHEKACKSAGKKRRVFDSKKNRLEGIDGMDEVLSHQQPPRRGAPKASAAAPPPSRGGGNADKPVAANAMPKWKLQHQQFQVALQAIKAAANPGSHQGPPVPMPEALDDRVPCPHCSRRFARDTADRHIPSCAKTVNKPKGLLRPGLARR